MRKAAVLISVLAGLACGQAHAAGDPAKGKRVFNKCKACHSLVAGKKKIGPSLYGMYGRKAGTVGGFKFSPAMIQSGIVWTPETLAGYLEDPKKVIPGNKMPFPGIKNKADLENLNAYLMQATK